MKYVYMLEHSRKVDSDIYESKLLGFFSTNEKAVQAISKYRTVIGFRDYPNDFEIKKFRVDYNLYNFITKEPLL